MDQPFPITPSAVLFLVFQRPHTTKAVFDAIRKARPQRLYVAADGPRPGRAGEKDRAEEVRKIATRIDWPCELKKLFRKENLGCKKAVSSAIDWFFEHEERGIILEDDCLPCESFFPFCNELLEKYCHDERVMVVSGSNFQFGSSRTQYSYYFSYFNHCWGWATWRRAWRHFDEHMEHWPLIRNHGFLRDLLYEKNMIAYWSRVFEATYNGGIDSWAYPWTFSCWMRNGLTILPNVNLVSNLGFGMNATHTKTDSKMAHMKADHVTFPLKHPPFLIRDEAADRQTHRVCYRPGWYRRLMDRLQLKKMEDLKRIPVNERHEHR